jgi:predicted ATPase
MEQSGFGLALCLDDILGYDRGLFTELERRFCDIFRQISSVKLIPEMAYRSDFDDAQQIPMLNRGEGKGIYFQFKGKDVLVPASQVSDGVLLVLAYLTILHLPQPPRVILVEEPENGIHPKRLKDVLGILKDLVSKQSHTQLILTTHSPYVVDMFDAGEVSICTKNEDGSVSVHRLSDSKTVREQLDVFTLGEIWTAEGDEALVKSTKNGEGAGQ